MCRLIVVAFLLLCIAGCPESIPLIQNSPAQDFSQMKEDNLVLKYWYYDGENIVGEVFNKTTNVEYGNVHVGFDVYDKSATKVSRAEVSAELIRPQRAWGFRCGVPKGTRKVGFVYMYAGLMTPIYETARK